MTGTATEKPQIRLPILPGFQEDFQRFLDKESPYDYEHQLVKSHSDRIRAIFQGKVVPPYEVEIQPSSKCNLACKHCFGTQLARGSHLEDRINTLGDMKTILNKVVDFRENGFKIDTVKFCGTTGEPLVNPITMPAIEMFKRAGKRVILFTNGLWLDKNYNRRPYWDFVLSADNLVLSLDCASPETFNSLKRNGKSKGEGFERILESLEKMVASRNGSPLIISVGYVIGKDNYHEIADAAKLLSGLGVNELRYRVDFTDSEGISEIAPYIGEGLEKAEGFASDGFHVGTTISDKERIQLGGFSSTGMKCFNQYFWACVGPDAELYACGHRTYPGVRSYGSLLGEKSFRDLLFSQERLKNLDDLPDDYCRFCSPSSFCRNYFMTFLESAIDSSKL